MSVDLPAPLGPSRPTRLGERSSRSRPRSACLPLGYVMATFLIVISISDVSFLLGMDEA